MFLGFQIAMDHYSIGLLREEGDVVEQTGSRQHGVAEDLILEIESLCEKADASLESLTGIGIVSGPGAYTGLRVGVTVAKTISQVRSIPVYSFSTLESMVTQYSGFDGLYFSTLPAIKGELNCGLFSVQKGAVKRLTRDFTMRNKLLLDKLERIEGPVNVIGQFTNDVKLIVSSLNQSNLRITPVILQGTTLARMASQAFQDGVVSDFKRVQPAYSHQPKIGEVKAHGKLL